MLQLFLALLIGIFFGITGILPRPLEVKALKLSTVGVVVLISSMGAKIGYDPNLLTNLALFGWQALVLAAAAVAGSVLVVWLLEHSLARFGSTSTGKDSILAQQVAVGEQKVSYALTYLIIGALLFGIGAGYWLLSPGASSILSTATNWALYVTLWSVGLDLGRNKETLQNVLKLGWKVLIAPVGVAAGSIAGSLLAGLALSMPLNESSAVGAGFGWYSLSGVLISQIYSVQTGTVAFLSNVLRELIAVISIPFLARRVGPLSAIAPGGATTMDTTLPLIAASAGPQTALIGFVSGLCLSTLVPFLVPLLIKL